ncbi:NAD-dependent epimerase/dehydratase family protein [Prochlorococcus sp. MIT 1223]|uniref:NAD-dependent epimerase/dehydratase family protein n=1 Tax=Prochlorococcus sp. MIT 1223 TaxID=3096217 RepID=UPI002A76082A|nr:NAD-dependent epimerase/dehydratase family protein [Prochlorococcus sp. MIT 1223]
MNIFITGGSGFLGRHLIRSLKREQGDNQITSPNSSECNLTIKDSLNDYSFIKYDRIYHLAAWTQAGDFCLKHPGEQWLINQLINTHVLDWWKQKQPQAKLIFMGTSCSYDPLLELKEENYMKGIPTTSLYTYALTKRMLLAGANALHLQYNMNYSCYIPSTLYGGDYHNDGRQMHFIFDLIRKIYNSKVTKEKALLWGDGSQRRELVHVDDFLNAMYNTADKVNNDLLNIGAGMDYSIQEFAQSICEYLECPEELIDYDTSRYVGAKSKLLDINKLKNMYKEYSPRSLKEGLKDSIDWYKNSKSNK